MSSNTFNNFAGSVIVMAKKAMTWMRQQDYTLITKMDEYTLLKISSGILLFCYFLFLVSVYMYTKKVDDSRSGKRKFVPEEFEEQDRRIKRRLSIQAEKYRHASAFQTIQQQVGEDPRSWPVVLLNEVILLREDLSRIQKKTF
jgi:hypothetical protein